MGLSALAGEIKQRFSGVFTPEQEEAYECWIAYFFSKIFARSLPKDRSRLGGTLEGQMYARIAELFHDVRAKKYRDIGKSVLNDTLSKKNATEIRRASEHIEDAMAYYEKAYLGAHTGRVAFAPGSFESGKK